MNLAIWIYIVLYLVMLCFYFHSRASNNFKKHAINKLVLSSLFMIFSISAYTLNHLFFSYHIIALIGVILAFTGDLLFLFNFNKGGIAFLCCNILFFIYEILLITSNQIGFSKIWWVILVFIVIYGTVLSLIVSNKIKLGEYKLPFTIYLASVSLHGTLAIPLIAYFYNSYTMLLAMGLILFMISDYLLLTYKFIFNDNKWIIRANSATYFIGLLLVSLSFL